MKTLKTMFKVPAAHVCAAAGRAGMWDWCDGFMMRHVVPNLMDKNVIPHAMTSVPLRNLGISIVCHPYAAHHISPYWTGRLVERSLDDLLRQLLKPGDTFLDIGANLGHVTCLAAALVGREGKVHAVEAHPWLSAALRDMLRGQHVDHAEVHGVALSDAPGSMDLHVCLSNIGANSLRDNVNVEKLRAHDDVIGHQLMHYAAQAAGISSDEVPESISVEVKRADDLFADLVPKGDVYAKIDVEGFEIQVLEGMRRVLRDTVSAVVVEITPEWIGGAEGVSRIFALLADLGYSGYILDAHGTDGKPKAVLAGDVVEQHNVLFAKQAVATRLNLKQPAAA